MLIMDPYLHVTFLSSPIPTGSQMARAGVLHANHTGIIWETEASLNGNHFRPIGSDGRCKQWRGDVASFQLAPRFRSRRSHRKRLWGRLLLSNRVAAINFLCRLLRGTKTGLVTQCFRSAQTPPRKRKIRGIQAAIEVASQPPEELCRRGSPQRA